VRRKDDRVRSAAICVPASWRRWVRANWKRVRVVAVELRRARADTGSRITIRAVVHLGALLPADVQVTVRRRHSVTRCESSGECVVRLWSVQSYRNGAYVFEAAVCPHEIDDGEGLVVQVHPAHGYVLRPVAAPVVTSIDEPKAIGMVKAAAKESIPLASLAATPDRERVSGAW
jgi:hypothetical protein